MDLLFKEYADPFSFLDNVIRIGSFSDFIDMFIRKKEEREQWEFYIHKLPPWDERTFDEFKQSLSSSEVKEQKIPTRAELETTVQSSYIMMKNFKIKVD